MAFTWENTRLGIYTSKVYIRAFVFQVFVISEGISCSAEFETHVTVVPRCLHVCGLNVFEYIGLHFGRLPTNDTLPLTANLGHFGVD